VSDVNLAVLAQAAGPPGDVPAHGPPDAPAEEFAPILAKAAEQAAEDQRAANETARTAHAEGEKAGGDSPGEQETEAPALAANLLVLPLPLQAEPVPASVAVPAALPVPTEQPQAQLPAEQQLLPQQPASAAVAAALPTPAPGLSAAVAPAPAAVQPAAPAAQAPVAAAEPVPAGHVPGAAPEARLAETVPVQAPADKSAPTTAPAVEGEVAPNAEETGPKTQQQGGERGERNGRETAQRPAQSPEGNGPGAGTETRPEETVTDRMVRTVAEAPKGDARTGDQPAAAPTVAPAAAARQADPAPVTARVQAEAPAAPAPGVRLTELVEAAGTVIRIAVRDQQGVARITLRPAELGSVDIRLTYGPGGVTAQLTAESPQAAQALAQASHELRRALEAQGLVVQSLDVQHAGGDDRPSANRDRLGSENGQQRGARGGTLAEPTDDPETTIAPSRLPLEGTQVDVLA
jgi:flagellar hook-length control protein FliK